MTTAFEIALDAWDSRVVAPGADTRALQAAIGNCRALAEAISIGDSGTHSLGQSFFEKARRLRKQLDEWRLAETKPFRDKETAINNHVRRLMDPLKEIESLLNEKIGVYHELVAADEKRRSADLFEFQQLFGLDADSAESTKAAKLEGEGSASYIREELAFRIVDIKKIPAEFLLVNEKAILQAIKEKVTIEGIEVYTEKKHQTKLKGKKK